MARRENEEGLGTRVGRWRSNDNRQRTMTNRQLPGLSCEEKIRRLADARSARRYESPEDPGSDRYFIAGIFCAEDNKSHIFTSTRINVHSARNWERKAALLRHPPDSSRNSVASGTVSLRENRNYVARKKNTPRFIWGMQSLFTEINFVL